MKTQPLSKTPQGNLAAARLMIEGLRAHGTVLGITELESLLASEIPKLEQAGIAADTADIAVTAAQEARKTALTGLRKLSTDIVKYAKPIMGSSWTTTWGTLGMKRGKVRAPRKLQAIVDFVTGYQQYLVNDATQELPSRGVTAANLRGTLDAYELAESRLALAMADRRLKADAQKAAHEMLKSRMRTVIAALGQLDANDPRWRAFGLRIPSDPRTPAAVESITAESTAPGEVTLKWPHAIRADRYRIYRKGTVAEEAFELVLRTPELEATITGLTAGAQYTFAVAAVNEAGEGVKTTVDITVQ